MGGKNLNEKAVKKLTKKGCIVEKEAAESLTQDDLRTIEEMDTTPMYISEKMLSEIRETPEDAKGAGRDAIQDPEKDDYSTTETGATEPSGSKEDSSDREDEAQEPGQVEVKSKGSRSVTIQDRRTRRIETKVEVLDTADISREEKDVPEFLNNYNDRYDRLKKLLMRRMELKSAVAIQRLDMRSEGEEAAVVGIVRDKYSTNSGRYIVELEDKTGSFKALVEERDGDRIVPDEVIGVRGSLGGDIIYANSVVRPDLPIPQGANTTREKVRAAYVSDFHLGSKDTLEERFDEFAEWMGSDAASDIGYLVIPGDVVEGVGTYPGQEEELKVTNIYDQYEMFEDWVEELPESLQLIVGPGNHDIVRLAEPQPSLPEKALPRISDFNNVHLVQNPQWVKLHGIESSGILNLMYHGYSFDDHVAQIQELREKAYQEPHHVMIDLLKRRHLAPTFGTNLLAPEDKDYLTIEREPDVFVAGHFHSHANQSYKGVNVICASTFQSQTDFQKRMGHEPDPGKVTVVDYKTRNTEVKQF